MSDKVSILQEIDKKIEHEKTVALELIKTHEEQSTFPANLEDEDISKELAQKLWMLKGDYTDASTAIKNGDLQNSLLKLGDLENKVNEFDTEYPNTLIVVDIRRKLHGLQSNLQAQLENQWNSAVSLTENKLVFRANSELHERALAPMSDFLGQFEKLIIEPIINYEIVLNIQDNILCWSQNNQVSLDVLATNLEILVSYVARAPAPLSSVIPRRFGTYLLNQAVTVSLPRIYPNVADPSEFQRELEGKLVSLDSKFQPLWKKSGVFGLFTSSLKEKWPGIRQEYYLMQLRQLYQTEVNEEARQTLVSMKTAEPGESEIKDEWDWDDNDDNNDDDTSANQDVETNLNKNTLNYGYLIDLWNRYTFEISEHGLFFTLYCALIPVVYRNQHLWIYEDTCKFLSHIEPVGSETEPLVQMCDHHLHKFISDKVKELEYETLPYLFTDQRSTALTKIRTDIDRTAVAINEIGGAELRQLVLSHLIECIAVYVIETIMKMLDIGDEESQDLASLITKLSTFGVYFEQVSASVPSWNKLEMLKTILKSNLVTIMELHSEHLLVDFSEDELIMLVQALFVDSPKRKEVIYAFRNT